MSTYVWSVACTAREGNSQQREETAQIRSEQEKKNGCSVTSFQLKNAANLSSPNVSTNERGLVAVM